MKQQHSKNPINSKNLKSFCFTQNKTEYLFNPSTNQLYMVTLHPRFKHNEYTSISSDNGLCCLACGISKNKHYIVNHIYYSPLKYKFATNYDANQCRICNNFKNSHQGMLHVFMPYENKIIERNGCTKLNEVELSSV